MHRTRRSRRLRHACRPLASRKSRTDWSRVPSDRPSGRRSSRRLKPACWPAISAPPRPSTRRPSRHPAPLALGTFGLPV
eukprot:2829057-Alexandrium_andersonii.AAC.1